MSSNALDRRWHRPAEWKALLSKFYDFSADGYTAKEAAAMAIADMRRHIEAAKRVDEKYPQGVRTPVPAQAPAPEPAPVRSAPPPIAARASGFRDAPRQSASSCGGRAAPISKNQAAAVITGCPAHAAS